MTWRKGPALWAGTSPEAHVNLHRCVCVCVPEGWGENFSTALWKEHGLSCLGEAVVFPRSLVTLQCGCGGWTSFGSPEGLLKQSSWSPWRLGLPFLGTHRKSKSPKFLAAPGPGKFEGRKRRKNVSGPEIRRACWLVGLDLREPAHRTGMEVQAQQRYFLEATSGPAPGMGVGWGSGLLTGAGFEKGQTAWMPTTGATDVG